MAGGRSAHGITLGKTDPSADLRIACRIDVGKGRHCVGGTRDLNRDATTNVIRRIAAVCGILLPDTLPALGTLRIVRLESLTYEVALRQSASRLPRTAIRSSAPSCCVNRPSGAKGEYDAKGARS